MASQITRRQLAAAVSASAALLAQTAPAPIPQNPDEELKAVREQLHQSAAAMERFPLPPAVEPAVHFKAQP